MERLSKKKTDPGFLAHHGILGQKWGIRRFQPYPSSYAGDGKFTGSLSEKEIAKKQKAVSDLSKELNESWDYGVLVNGKRVTESEIDDFDWEKNYRTLPLKQLRKEKIGVCWDFVNYQHDQLKKKGIKDSSYLLVMALPTKENPNRVVTHTFTTYELGGKEYWLESAMWPKRGVHEIKDYKQAVNSIKSQYTDKAASYSVFKYNPEGLDQGLTDKEFFDRATDGNLVLDVKAGRTRKN